MGNSTPRSPGGSTHRQDGPSRPSWGNGLHGPALLAALRPHQWTKNLPLLLPLLMSGQGGWSDPARRHKLLCGLLALVAFSLCASAAYALNDVRDVEADRAHPSKRRRPFASGRLPLRLGPPLALALLAASSAITLLALPMRFAEALAFYFVLTLSYSFYFKRKLVLDVVLLACLYTLRIVAGAVAVTVPLTTWMLAFSMFFFLSLAFAKRYTELRGLQSAPGAGSEGGGGTEAKGRGYRVEDLDILPAAGLAAGYLSVLVFALFVNDIVNAGAAGTGAAGAMSGIGGLGNAGGAGRAGGGIAVPRIPYSRPYLLWLICPVLLYWVTRLWFLARRGALHDDPVVFAIRDRASWAAGVLAAALVVLASLPRGFAGLPW